MDGLKIIAIRHSIDPKRKYYSVRKNWSWSYFTVKLGYILKYKSSLRKRKGKKISRYFEVGEVWIFEICFTFSVNLFFVVNLYDFQEICFISLQSIWFVFEKTFCVIIIVTSNTEVHDLILSPLKGENYWERHLSEIAKTSRPGFLM